MPRKKMIDTDSIRLEKVDDEIIGKKNCLQAELSLKEQLTPLNVHTLRTYYKFVVADDRKRVSFSLRNSWKGLIMACLSIAYCKYEKSIIKKMIQSNQYLITQVDFKYDNLNGEFVELIPAPPSWKPCYVTGSYNVRKIHDSLKYIENLLDLNPSQSFVTTNYITTPSPFKNYTISLPLETKRWRISNFLDCAGGIALITNETMEKLYGNRAALGAPCRLKPEGIAQWTSEFDDYGKPMPLFGYEVSASTVNHLITYFPFLKADFMCEAKKQNSPWVVFDRVHLGKWG